MIHKLSSKLIKTIELVDAIPCVSIYLPMKKGHKNAEENRILFKNAVNTAKRMISHPNMPQAAARDKKWLVIANQLAGDAILWKNQQKGLAVFLWKDAYYAISCNDTFEKRVFVGDTFIVEPLYATTQKAPRNFWVLALSQKFTRLFKVENSVITQVDEDKIPKNLKQTLRIDEYEKELQTHPIALGGTKNSEGFHGHGYHKDREETELQKYLRHVARAVKKSVKKSDDPMLVLGTARISNQYRQFNQYKHLISSDLHLNADHLNAKQIYKTILAGK